MKRAANSNAHVGNAAKRACHDLAAHLRRLRLQLASTTNVARQLAIVRDIRAAEHVMQDLRSLRGT